MRTVELVNVSRIMALNDALQSNYPLCPRLSSGCSPKSFTPLASHTKTSTKILRAGVNTGEVLQSVAFTERKSYCICLVDIVFCLFHLLTCTPDQPGVLCNGILHWDCFLMLPKAWLYISDTTPCVLVNGATRRASICYTSVFASRKAPESQLLTH